jgi:putative FmdB family regulatory protein
MPIYEYECQECNQITEAMQKFSDPPLDECPHCQGTLRKMISQSSFHLKGGGWYVTDYARKDGSSTQTNKDKPAETSHKTVEKTADVTPGSSASPSPGTTETKS